jgi:prepilin-type processing-associated H-X9-DG protein
MYSADHHQNLPWAGRFRYALMEGLYYHSFPPPEAHNWTTVNSGSLFARYLNRVADVFYCPSNMTFSADNPDNGMSVFLQRFSHPRRGDPEWQNSHNFPISPYSSYVYAVPAAISRSPRDAGRQVYPLKTIRNNWPCETGGSGCADAPYYQYLNDPAEPDPGFLGPFPRESRGRHNLHALLSDGYYSDGNLVRSALGYHGGGYNVLYSDFHARWVVDPGGVINRTPIPPVESGTYPGINDAKVFMIWDYFSRNH